MFFRLSTLILLLACCCLAQAEKPTNQASDVAGSWRWDSEYNGNVIKNLLQLKQGANGGLTSTLTAERKTIDVSDPTAKDGKLKFSIEFEREDARWTGCV